MGGGAARVRSDSPRPSNGEPTRPGSGRSDRPLACTRGFPSHARHTRRFAFGRCSSPTRTTSRHIGTRSGRSQVVTRLALDAVSRAVSDQAIREGIPKIDPALREEARPTSDRRPTTTSNTGVSTISCWRAADARAYEQTLADVMLRPHPSLAFRLAYAAGFETMALAIGHMLVRHRTFFFADADPSVSSLVLALRRGGRAQARRLRRIRRSSGVGPCACAARVRHVAHTRRTRQAYGCSDPTDSGARFDPSHDEGVDAADRRRLRASWRVFMWYDPARRRPAVRSGSSSTSAAKRVSPASRAAST